MFNGYHDHAVAYVVSLYSADGQLAAERTVTLEALGSFQRELKKFFQSDDIEDWLFGLTVLPLDDADSGVQGRSWAYVSIVDNRTNDPVNLW